jgi:alkylhydroperoxidase family enzyme
VLRKNFFSAGQIIAIQKDYRNAGLEPVEVALMTFARRITLEPGEITHKEFDDLRGFGLTDAEILDVVLAVAARNFFSKSLDAMGAEPDEVYKDMEPELRKALTTGRSF